MINIYSIVAAATFWGGDISAALPKPLLLHELEIRLHPSQQMLSATDEVTISYPGFEHLSFEMADHLTIEAVMLNDSKALPFTFRQGRLRIDLPPTPRDIHLRIAYRGRFDDPVPTEPLNADNPGYGVTGTISSRGTMLLAGAGWYPRAENAPSVYRIAVQAPKGIVAVTSGKPLGHTQEQGQSVSNWLVDRPLRGIPLVAGPYQVAIRRFGQVTAATYFSAPLKDLSDAYLDATGRYLQLYQELFGAYAFEQFAVVENFFPTGYGFPSFTLMGRRVLRLPFILHTSLGHEIAHCWWGNGVLVDTSQGNWSEGLTTYVADYLYQERKGKGRPHRLQWLRRYTDLVNDTNDFPASRFLSRQDPATQSVGYDKVAMVFHMLRRKVGEDIFWPALRDLYTGNRFNDIPWSAFQTLFEKRANLSLEKFFKQWIFQPGAPRLSLSHVIVTPLQLGFNINGAVLQKKPYYDLTIDLAVTTDQATSYHTVEVSGARSPFTITVQQPPRQLQADPEVHTFRRLSPEEMPPTVNTLKGAPHVTVVVARSLGAAGQDIARRLSAALGLTKLTIGDEKAFTGPEHFPENTLFIGTPAQPAWMPAKTDQFAVTAQDFRIFDKNYPRKKTSFFIVFKHPNQNGILAFFIPKDLSMAQALTPKIPHYGKYSYLVFKDTRNQTKGTWETDQSPMMVRWPVDFNPVKGGNP